MLTYLDPVLLCNDLDAQAGRDSASHAVIPSSGHQSISVKEAVRMAQSNNLMGLICTSALLVCLVLSRSRYPMLTLF